MAKSKLTTKEKMGIGFAGGVSLALLYLTENRFFLLLPAELGSAVKVVGYLNAISFLAIGTIYATIAKEDVPRKVFTNALMAPSLLMAIVHGATGVEAPPSSPTGNLRNPAASVESASELPDDLFDFIEESTPVEEDAALILKTPELIRGSEGAEEAGGLRFLVGRIFSFSTAASAQPITLVQNKPSNPADSSSVVFQVIKKKNVTFSKGEKLRSTFGRIPTKANKAIVIAKTDDKAKAEKVASELNKKLQIGKGQRQVIVLQPEGQKTYYISFGGLQSNANTATVLESLRRQTGVMQRVGGQKGDPFLSLAQNSRIVDFSTAFSEGKGKK